jgi:excisionase family DNA binding protein
MRPRLLDLQGAAAYLSVSAWTLRDMLAAGTLRAVRLPGAGGRDLRRILLDVCDLDSLVERIKADASSAGFATRGQGRARPHGAGKTS